MIVSQFKTVTKFGVVELGCSGKMVIQKPFYDALNQELLFIANSKNCVEVGEPEISITVDSIRDMEARGYSYESNNFVGEKPARPNADSSIIAYTAIIPYKIITDPEVSDSDDGSGLEKIIRVE